MFVFLISIKNYLFRQQKFSHLEQLFGNDKIIIIIII